ETALDAEPVLIRRAVSARDVEELVVPDVIGELAADAAIGADAVHLAVGLAGEHVVLVDQRRRHQGAGRAALHALPPRAAGHSAGRAAEVEACFGLTAAPRRADHVVDLSLGTGADAEITVYAGVEIDRHSGMAAVGPGPRIAREAAGLYVLPLGDLPELGVG